jgi:hypothetical protein
MVTKELFHVFYAKICHFTGRNPIDILNPLGVPSRMNVGQLYECLLGLAVIN